MIERIRRRLTLGYVGVFGLILVLFCAIVLASFSQGLTFQQDRRLVQRAEEAAGFVRDHGPGGPEEGEPAKVAPRDAGYGPDDDRGPDEDIAVYSVPPAGANVGDSEVYGESPGPGPEGSTASSLGLPFVGAAREAEEEAGRGGRHEGRPEFATFEGPRGEVRVASLPVTNASGEVIAVVQAAESRRMIEETVGGLILVLIAVGVGSLLLAGLGGLFMSGRAMRPVVDSFRRQRTFVADASHELKTPLALVKIGAEVMRRDPTNPENAAVVEDQLAEIDRMDALLSDLLTLARLDAGRLDVEEKPFDLALVAGEAAGRFLKRAASEGIHVEVDVPDELAARGDAEKSGQILAALLDNAVRHTPEGGTITVAARPRDGLVEASVTDAGPGVPPEHLPRIFDRFYRAEEARSRKGGGTGLGLAIARDLARAQNGELSAQNTPDGARFTLVLPAGA